MSPYALAAYIELERQRADITTRNHVTTFRAYLVSTNGPDRGGSYKLTLGTDTRHKDALWELTNHQGEFFEIQIHTIRVYARPPQSPPIKRPHLVPVPGWVTEPGAKGA